jgi:hypothetical protein
MSHRSIRAAVLCGLLLGACAMPIDGRSASTPSSAPLLGAADGQDAADRACRVVLRSAGRATQPDGRPSTECIDGLCWLAFEAAFDVAEEALAAGATPALLYRDPNGTAWYEASAVAVPGAPSGFARFRARFAQHTVRDGISTTALTRTRLELVPFVHTPSGGRLFDHNQHPGDFDNHWLLGTDGFALTAPATVCPGRASAAPDAVLTFAADWSERVDGTLRAGGRLAVDYAIERLAQCHGDTYMAQRTWDTRAYVRALPSGALAQASVVACDDARCATPRSARATFEVPEGTTSVELWFQTSGRSCGVHHDSDFGSNYRFAIARPVGWVGGFVAKISRAGGAPCEGFEASGVGDGVSYGTWARTRAVTSHVCFRVWSDGVTDREPIAPGAVQATVECLWDGESTPRTHAVAFDARVGNDARYRLDLRGVDPFQMYRCPEVPTRLEGGYVTASATCSARVNGASWGPSGATTAFRLTFSDYPESGWRDANCR